MKVIFNKLHKVSPNGFDIKTYFKDDVAEFEDRQALFLIKHKIADRYEEDEEAARSWEDCPHVKEAWLEEFSKLTIEEVANMAPEEVDAIDVVGLGPATAKKIIAWCKG